MKFRTFRNTVSLVGFVLFGGTCYGCYAYWQHNIDEKARIAREEAEATAVANRLAEERAQKEAALAAAEAEASAKRAAADAELRQRSAVAYYQDAAGLRDLDRELLALLDGPVQAKIKDASHGKAYKINLYSDKGKEFNRAKVDLDRDEQDDEVWTIKGFTSIERKVSTKDNGDYDDTFVLYPSGWKLTKSKTTPLPTEAPATAPTPPPTTTTTATTAAGLRDVDQDMLALLRQPAEEKLKDATKGKSYKINLYSDDRSHWNRAKVDLDRDDKWDESWTFKDGTTERKVAPNDDENYTQVWVLSGTGWSQK